jgi:large repetitive protein
MLRQLLFRPGRRLLRPVTALMVCLCLLLFHSVAQAAATPSATLVVSSTMPIGADFSFTVTFDNTGTNTGYGPFVDLILPVTGTDGAGAALDDGIDFSSAAYLGQPVVATQLTFPPGVAPTCAAHPYAVDNTGAPIQVCGTPGDKLIVLQLPFGSFTPAQPPAEIVVNAHMSNLADLNVPLTIQARSGFQYGTDPLANPTVDPSITGSFAGASVNTTATLFTLTKNYIGPEDETATGPNFPRQYEIIVDIAVGQTITNLDLTDVLPNNMQFVSLDAVTGNGTGAITPISTPSASAPGGTLARRLDTVVGTSSANDARMLFTFYIPRIDASSAAIINPNSGDDALSIDDARAQGNWQPIDPRDPPTPVVSDVTTQDHLLSDRSIAIQKSVANVNDVGVSGYSVGDTLEYTVQFQISDYFAFQNIVISDTISDGQHYDSSFTPRLMVGGNGFTLPAAGMSAANYTVAPNYTPAAPAPNDGTTTFTFRVSDELVTRGQTGRLIGGCVPPAGTGGPPPDCTFNDGATAGMLVFRTIIQDRFTDTYPSGDPPIDSGDRLNNTVTITGDVLNADTLAPTGLAEADTSAAGLAMVFGQLSKTIYARNGVIGSATEYAPGDTITYRISYSLAASDFEGLSFIDYLPLPILASGEVTTFDATYDPTGAAPTAGHFKLGPADTYHARPGALNPTLATNAAQNSLSFIYGTYDDPANVPTTIDILFTVTVSNAPFADGLFLTNQVREQDGSTNAGTHTADSIVQIELTEPVLNTHKGVVATNNVYSSFTPPAVGPVGFSAPGGGCARFAGTITSAGLAATPINSNLNDSDAGDRVTFAIVVENTGRGLNGAFDVRVRDTLPAGFAIPGGAPGLNLCVTDGTGAALPFSSLGAGLFDPTGGIELTDPGPLTGALAAGQDGSGNPSATGRNIAIITYDLAAQIGAQPRQAIVNTATLYNYAGQNGGADHTNPVDLSDTGTVTIALPALAKRFVDTEIISADNASDQAVIGELVTYEVTLTVPEGTTPNAAIVDTLDAGLAFVDVLSVTPLAGVTIGGSTTPVITGSGATITFNLGAVTNADTDDDNQDTITLTYRAVVLDVIGNQNGTLLNNSAAFTWTGGNLPAVAAQNITVIEPSLDTGKSVVINGSTTSGDAGDPVVYTIVIQHTGASTADAFDVTFSDPLPKVGAGGPSLIDNPTFGVVDTAGLVTAANFSLTGSNAAGWSLDTVGSFDMPRAPAGRTITITINGTLSNSVTPGSSVTNTATTQWTSLDGAPGTRSASNANSTERTGAGGVNDYSDPGAATLTVFAPNPIKTIVATSEPHTGIVSGIQRVVIGEIVRYRLEVRLAEGTSPSFQLLDRLDAGLRFLNDGTARVAFVANESGITSSDPTIAGAGLNVTGNSGSVAPTFALPDAAVSSSPAANLDTYNDGTDVYFRLGNLTNTNSDSDSEYVVVEFNLLVTNITSSQAFNNGTGTAVTPPGTTRNNDFQVLVNGSLLATSTQGATNQVIIAEPVVRNLTKTVTTAPTDAGDTVVYTLTFGNTPSGVNAAAAFDVIATDVLNANLSPQSVTGSITAGATCSTMATTFTGTITGQAVTGTVNCLNPGAQMTMVITARVVATAPAGQIIPNNSSLTSTSLPGTIGTCPNATGSCVNSVAGFGTPGSATGERNGSNGTGGLNDYVSASSTVNVTLATPTIDKLAPSPAQYTIGDQIVYNILVTLPEGVTRNLVVFDDLPAGLAYVGHQVITTAAASGGQLAADYGGTLAPEFLTAPGGSGGDVTLSFGDTTTTDDNNTGNNRFLVRLTARVLNLFPGSQDGVSLTNSAAVRYLNPNTAATATVNDPTPPVISLIEPRIATTKSVTPNANVQAGTVLTYIVRFTNTGNSTAYDVTATDTLAQGTAFTALTGCVNQGGTSVPASATPAGATVVFDSSPAGGWDIPATNPDSYIECTYTATAQSSLYVQGTHINTIDADWSSQDGAANPQDRAYNDATAYPFDATQDTASATFGVTGAAFGKSDNGATQAPIGNVINYTLTITSPLGTIRGLVVGDTLPAGLIYSGGFTVNGISTAPVFSASTPNDGSAQVDLTWNFGDAVVTSSPATITFSARVANVLGNQQGGARMNTAALNHRDAADVAQPPLSAQDSFTIVEPTLTIDKSITPASANVGDVVTFRITVANPSTVTAYDITAGDIVPNGMTYVAGSIRIVSGPAGTTSDTTTPTLAWNFPAIPAGQVAVLEFDARIDGSGSTTITNTASVTWTSRPGASADERSGADGPGGTLNDYAATDAATLLTAAYQISKTVSALAGGLAGVNDTVSFSIVITNTGATTLQTVPLTDTYDTAYLTYVSANPVSDDNNDDGLISWADIGSIAPGATRTIDVTFTARAITAALPGGVTINLAGASGVLDTSGTALSARGDDAAVVISAPDLRVSKTDGQTITTPGATLTYTIVVTNVGDITASGVVLTETLPANASFAGGSVAWVAQGSGVYTYALPAPLAPGQTATMTFAATIDNPLPAGVAQITNTVQAGDDGAHGSDPTPADNSATDIDMVDAAPDLQLYKSDDGAVRPPGDFVTYSLDYTNVGNQDATGVVITETVPLYTTFNASGSTPGWSCADGSPAGTICTFTIGNVAVGELNNVLFATTIVNPIPAGVSEITNSATVSDDRTNGNDPTPADNTSSDTTPVTAAPDLSVTKSDGGVTTSPSGTVVYTLSYTNTGNVGASNVLISETVPANSRFNAGASTTGWSCANGAPAGTTCTLNIGTVAGGGTSGSATFAVTVDNPLPAGVAQIANSATIGDDGANGSDPTPADNSSSDTTAIVSTPDLVIAKSDGGVTAMPGDIVTYTLIYTNVGNIGATGVVISETVPANSSFNAGASTAGWACIPNNSAGSTCAIAIGNILSSAGGSVTFAVTVDTPLPAGVTQVANSASIADDGTNGSDPTPADNSSNDTTPVSAQPDLAIRKSDGGMTTTPGGVIAYTLSYTNTGNQNATGVAITEVVPANTTFNAGASAAGWACVPSSNAGSTCSLAIGNLVVGASGSTTFAVTVDTPLPAGVRQIANIATIADDGSNGIDPTPGDNTGRETTPTIAAPDLQLNKSDGGILVLLGAPITYTLTYTNVGAIAATGVVITETVPANTIFSSSASLPTLWSCADGAPAGTACTTTIGTVAGGGTGSVRFAAIVNGSLPPGVTQIINTAVIGDDGASGADPTLGDNTGSDAAQLHPTAIMLVSFTATSDGDTIVVRWVTSAELNTWGFQLYRSTDGTREHAVRVTPQLILGTGRGQGASYSWIDTTTETGVRYTYWLQEIEVDRTTYEYGPASAAREPAASRYHVFLPFVGQ